MDGTTNVVVTPVSSPVGRVASVNPGCMLQVQNGCRAAGLKVRIAHPVTLLAEAYRGDSPSSSS